MAQAIYRQVERVIDSRKTVIFLHDEQRQDFEVALHMLDGRAETTLPRWFPLGSGLRSGVATQRRAIRTSGYGATRQQEAVVPLGPSLAYPHWLGVPMIAQEQVVGVLALQRRSRPFTDEDERFLTNAANVACLAVRASRLYEETERQRREAEVLSELAGDVNASLDLDTVLQRIVEGAKELCGSDQARIAVITLQGDKLLVR